MAILSGKTALVTGASKGIGAGIAKALGRAGASVVVNYASSKAGAEKVVAEIVELGGKAVAVQADTSKSADIKRLFAESKKAFGTIDILVNNAGVFKFDPIEDVTEDEFHRQFNINVLGPLLATQEAVKQFRPEGGNVINVSSVVSRSAIPASSIYSATKSALDSMTRTLAAELGPKNIRVNSINPGYTLTEGVHEVGISGSDMEKGMVASTPLGRAGQPEDIGKVAVFLASSESWWVTGESLAVSGGLR
ncbi:MAG: glucose 1-dehydrogenase [Bdellovibrionota bacterium]